MFTDTNQYSKGSNRSLNKTFYHDNEVEEESGKEMFTHMESVMMVA